MNGKVVLVTGGTRGIGRAIVEAFAMSGAKVVCQYKSSEREARELENQFPEHVFTMKCDLANPDEITNLHAQVINRFESIDTLVNNAGIAKSTKLEENPSNWTDDWDTTFHVNTRAVGLLCKLFIPHFKRNGGGRIINISSRAAFRGDTLDYLAYGASKGAIPAITKSIARYCGKDNIKAFTIAPGFVRTDMAQDFMDQYGEDFALNDIALNNLTEPKDLAPTVLFLASGLADHATGTTIDINAASYVR